MYNIVIRHLNTLWDKPSYHLSPCKVITLLLSTLPMLSLHPHDLIMFYKWKFTSYSPLPFSPMPPFSSPLATANLFSVFVSLRKHSLFMHPSSISAEAGEEWTSCQACLCMLLTEVFIRNDCGKCELGSALGEMSAQNLALTVSDDQVIFWGWGT